MFSRSIHENRITSYYLLNQHARHYIRELAGILRLDPSNLQKKLRQLEEQGFLQSEFQGKQRYYQLNKAFPLLKEYTAAFRKRYGIQEDLKRLLEDLPGVDQAYLFGSYTKKTFDELSDVDVLVVGEHDSLRLAKILHELEHRTQRQINVVEYGTLDFNKRKKSNPFLADVLSSQPIRLI
ncbi:MAG: nucleotidyltransferase domain-containing protein [Parcubacteria group bacterium]|nr:nucleotidyltransferase domain-containing protein [Parcubacteria group bacterium]